MEKVFDVVFLVLGAIGVLFFVSLFFSVPAWLLWNYCLVGAVDGVHEVTWLQAWGIGILCNLLFKNTSYKKD